MSVSTANNSQVQLTEEAKEVIKNLVRIDSEQRNQKKLLFERLCELWN